MTRINDSDVENRLTGSTRLECRICWYVYDPAEGDEYEQIPPGTAFSELPDHWRCPQCDAEMDKFLPLEE
ncbi:MAG: rubredoxin [Gammaproteobacteria bacterium]